MEDNFKHVVYSKNVIEFVTVANEFCLLLESCGKVSEEEFVAMAQKIQLHNKILYAVFSLLI